MWRTRRWSHHLGETPPHWAPKRRSAKVARYEQAIAIGRENWQSAALRAGNRAAAAMSLNHSAKLNGLDPYAYSRRVLERLPTQPASRIAELLPHRWTPLAICRSHVP